MTRRERLLKARKILLTHWHFARESGNVRAMAKFAPTCNKLYQYLYVEDKGVGNHDR